MILWTDLPLSYFKTNNLFLFFDHGLTLVHHFVQVHRNFVVAAGFDFFRRLSKRLECASFEPCRTLDLIICVHIQ